VLDDLSASPLNELQAGSGLADTPEPNPVQTHGAPADRGSSVLDNGASRDTEPGHTAEVDEAQPAFTHVDPRDPLSQPIDDSGPHRSRPAPSRRSPAHLDDYICYTTRFQDPLSLKHQLQKDSSGTPYPIANYVTSTNFSTSHQNFLATITKIT